MKKQLASALGAAAIASAVSLAPNANAGPQEYFSTLADYHIVIWDYPLALQEGYTICQLLWDDVNPMPWMMSRGYDVSLASDYIVSAKLGLCPGNAVTS